MQWHPKWDVERAIAETVGWYRDVYEGGNALDISSRQISAYMESK
jgi:hypothetical protein